MSKQLIEQIPVANCTWEQYSEIISLLKEQGYECHISPHDDIHSIIIDTLEKKISQASITWLAAWCGFRRYPLNHEQFMKNHHKLIPCMDAELYRKLTMENPLGKECGICLK